MIQNPYLLHLCSILSISRMPNEIVEVLLGIAHSHSHEQAITSIQKINVKIWQESIWDVGFDSNMHNF